jgi:hypothetical protein
MEGGLVFVPGKWEIEYRHSAGVYGSKFLSGLREGRIYGVRCPSCRRVLLPPRAFCDRCHVKVSDWVEVKDEGSITTFLIVYRKFWGLPDPPYAVALIKLDGSDEAILHFIGEVDLSTPDRATQVLKVGTRVKAVWKPPNERTGSILDIKYFKPI